MSTSVSPSVDEQTTPITWPASFRTGDPLTPWIRRHCQEAWPRKQGVISPDWVDVLDGFLRHGQLSLVVDLDRRICVMSNGDVAGQAHLGIADGGATLAEPRQPEAERERRVEHGDPFVEGLHRMEERYRCRKAPHRIFFSCHSWCSTAERMQNEAKVPRNHSGHRGEWG